jgi:hypothetical protein
MRQTMKRRWFNLETRPSRLFGDKDRDGVANVFDCQPRNRRRQDNDKLTKRQIRNKISRVAREKAMSEGRMVTMGEVGKEMGYGDDEY